MKPGSVLINTSRGGVVETRALDAALGEGRLAGAVVDVWEGEPQIDDRLLLRVTLGTPHIAGYSLDGKVNAVSMIRSALCRFLGEPSTWDPWREISPPDVPSVSAAVGTAPEESLRRAVHVCYDIEVDDRHLRNLAGLPPESRSGYFRGLRTGYRIRREFGSVRVDPVPPDEVLRRVFAAAGFRI
jgi:erythronate-4-phosphate dehydrogenase